MRKKVLTVVVVVAMILSLSVMMSGCGKKAEIADSYYSGQVVSIAAMSLYDAIVTQASSLTLLTDDNYVCNIQLSEGVNKNGEFGVSKPLNIIGITLYGTYEKVYDAELDETTVKLSEASRIVYTGTSSGATMATFGVVDTADEASCAEFGATFWGGVDGLKAAVGGAKEIKVNDTNKTIITSIYDYKSPFFPMS